MRPIFPSVESADEHGLLMIGGELQTDWLLTAYRSGIFPWPFTEGNHETLGWFSPDPRAIIELDAFHVSRRLAATIRSDRFEVAVNRNFRDVIVNCATVANRSDAVWITPAIMEAYYELHEQGFAHSVETYSDGELVGGVYGIAIGGYFAGESMFHLVRDASKVALAALVRLLRVNDFSLFDVQIWSPHLGRFGATEIARDDFMLRLQAALAQNTGWPT